jgi:hypothetical protein
MKNFVNGAIYFLLLAAINISSIYNNKYIGEPLTTLM